MRRAISRHSIVDGLTRVACPAARWLMRETSLLATNRLSSCSSRSTRSKAACAAWRGVARVGVDAVDLEHRGHRRVGEAVRAGHRSGSRPRRAGSLRPSFAAVLRSRSAARGSRRRKSSQRRLAA